MNGILVVNKEYGCTSRDVVNEITKIFNTKKIGHTGTLDPIATGVLVICIGKATKLVEILTSTQKEYIAEVTLGIDTDTLDNTGEILKEENVKIEKQQITNCLNSMIGFYDQEVPIYSAVKINGKKLYEYARNNEQIELPKRNVEIKSLELIDEPIYENNKTIFQIKCTVSKGTYIRSLIRDISRNLNTIGVMSKLNRTKQGNFLIENSYTLDDIKNNNYNLLPIDTCLTNYENITVDEELESKIKNGSILPYIYKTDKIVFKNKENKILGIYKTYEKDNTKIKPWKMF